MKLALYFKIRCLVGRMLYWLHPRAFLWRYIKKRNPDKSIITCLGSSLKVRIYPYDTIGRDIYVYRMFERAECRFVTKFLKKGMTLFDVGANLGQYTLLGAQCVGDEGKVYSFEPSLRMFGELNFNVELNSLSNICTLNNVAVSDSEGTAKLSKYQEGSEIYGTLGSQDWAPNSSIIGYEEVKTITLDKYIEENVIGHIDLIKIDIEGAELLALRGARQLLLRPDPPAIVMEMADLNTEGFGYKAIEIWDYLEDLGYCMHRFNKIGDLSVHAKRPVDFMLPQNLVAIKDS